MNSTGEDDEAPEWGLCNGGDHKQGEDRKEHGQMYQTYEVRSGDRLVGVRTASTPQAALFDYVRSLGCLDEDIERLAPDVIAWRGAVFRAVVQGSRELHESQSPG